MACDSLCNWRNCGEIKDAQLSWLNCSEPPNCKAIFSLHDTHRTGTMRYKCSLIGLVWVSDVLLSVRHYVTHAELGLDFFSVGDLCLWEKSDVWRLFGGREGGGRVICKCVLIKDWKTSFQIPSIFFPSNAPPLPDFMCFRELFFMLPEVARNKPTGLSP